MILPSEKGIFSHMPFLHDFGGSLSMLLCLSDSVLGGTDKRIKYRAWRIHSCDLKTNAMTRIETGSSDDEVECSPVCYYWQDKFTVSFVRGRWIPGREEDEYRELRLLKMTGDTLSSLSKPEPVLPFRVRAGFDWYGKAVFAIGDGRVMHDNLDGVGRYETDVGMKVVTRLAPQSDHTTNVLVTGFVEGESLAKTLVYDLDKRAVTGEVTTPDGEPTYKPTVFGEMMAHVVDAGDGVEEYKVDFLKDNLR